MPQGLVTSKKQEDEKANEQSCGGADGEVTRTELSIFFHNEY
jgi:hypothetical protein